MPEFKKSYRSFFAVLFLFVFSMNFVAEDLYVDPYAHGYLEHHGLGPSQEHAQDNSIMFIAVPVVVPAATATIAAAAEVTAGICFLGGCIYSIVSSDSKAKYRSGSNSNGKNNRCYCEHFCGLGCDCVCYCPCGAHNRQEQEEAKKHPHGMYSDADYHHGNSKGNGKGGKSPAPKNGQKALDNSVKIPGDGTARIGVSEGQIVVLSRTAVGLFHGHVMTWQEFQSMRYFKKALDAMIKDGLINNKGKTLK